MVIEGLAYLAQNACFDQLSKNSSFKQQTLFIIIETQKGISLHATVPYEPLCIKISLVILLLGMTRINKWKEGMEKESIKSHKVIIVHVEKSLVNRY